MLRSIAVGSIAAALVGLVSVSSARAEDWKQGWITNQFTDAAIRQPSLRAGAKRSARSASKSIAAKSARVTTRATTVKSAVAKKTATRAIPRTRSGDGVESTQRGIASFYWQPQRLASGGYFNPDAMTAAHRYLPFWSRVRVTHLGNGRSVEVVINDRGPFIAGRIIDLSRAAAGVIGMRGQGVAQVRVEVLRRGR